ncbi:hypothetical protein RSSM_00039 [Rhodopirellula sallentina SM41]|uniref:Uncharacterized protein n=1 Tax=Rhodopirellula sallentina SM41 TaxID=1263870 RepID=M5UAQ1_9BACT|nr:hypothetical protein RSSM_00039 [Rhodopirellula sallentina SM41]
MENGLIGSTSLRRRILSRSLGVRHWMVGSTGQYLTARRFVDKIGDRVWY